MGTRQVVTPTERSTVLCGKESTSSRVSECRAGETGFSSAPLSQPHAPSQERVCNEGYRLLVFCHLCNQTHGQKEPARKINVEHLLVSENDSTACALWHDHPEWERWERELRFGHDPLCQKTSPGDIQEFTDKLEKIFAVVSS